MSVKRFYLFLLVLLSLSGVVLGQSSTSTPYSLAAYGERVYGGTVEQQMMGRVSLTRSDFNRYSIDNPATLSNLRYTMLDIGARAEAINLSTTSESAYRSGANFSYGLMAMPISSKKRIGMSFGITPYSDVGYEIISEFPEDSIPYQNIFYGEGGLNNFHFAVGYQPLQLKRKKDSVNTITHGLSIGIKYNFTFGKLASVTDKRFDNNPEIFSMVDDREWDISGNRFDLGAHYYRQNTKGLTHSLGGTFTLGSELNASKNRLLRTYMTSLPNYTFVDTILFNEGENVTAPLPSGFGFGYSIEMPRKWFLGVEYQQENWNDINSLEFGNSFKSNKRFAIGSYIIPSGPWKPQQPFLGRVQYNIGLRYEQTFFQFFDQQIEEVGISFGFGLPTVKTQRTTGGKLAIVSRVYIGGEYFVRGTTDNSLIKEEHYRLFLGLTLGDKWFNKRKYQ